MSYTEKINQTVLEFFDQASEIILQTRGFNLPELQ